MSIPLLILTYSPGQTPIDRMAELLLVAFKRGFRLTKVLRNLAAAPANSSKPSTVIRPAIKPIHGSNRVRKLTQLVKRWISSAYSAAQ